MASELSRLIPKYWEPVEDTVIVSLQFERELKTFICNSIRELPVMLKQIKQEAFLAMEKAFQQFLQVYKIMPNMKTPASQSPAEVMFARRIRSVYDKLLPKQIRPATASIVPTKKKKNTTQERKFTLKCSRIINHSGKQVQLRKG